MTERTFITCDYCGADTTKRDYLHVKARFNDNRVADIRFVAPINLDFCGLDCLADWIKDKKRDALFEKNAEELRAKLRKMPLDGDS